MYLPEPLSVLILYQNPVMLKQYSLGMTGLESGLGSVLVLGQVVRTEAVTQTVVRPFFETPLLLEDVPNDIPAMFHVNNLFFASSLVAKRSERKPSGSVLAHVDNSTTTGFRFSPS